jgi:exopolysaccharide biosynthesis polyprenyl glycosylphosphotransferase
MTDGRSSMNGSSSLDPGGTCSSLDSDTTRRIAVSTDRVGSLFTDLHIAAREPCSGDRGPGWLEDIAPHSAETCDAALRWLLPAFELMAIMAAFAYVFPPASEVDRQLLVVVAAATAAIWLLAGQITGFHGKSFLRFSGRHMIELGALWLLVIVTIWAGAAFSPANLPAAAWPMVFLIGGIGLLLVRLSAWVFAGRLAIRGDARQQIAVIGRASASGWAIAATQEGRPGSRICAVIDPDSRDGRSAYGTGPLQVDEVVLALRPGDPILDLIIARLRTLPVAVSLLSMEGGKALIRLQSRPLSGGAQILKRGFDIVASVLLLLMFAPLMLLLAALIKASDPKSPVFYLQQRHGFSQTPFFAYKFRTMATASGENDAHQAVRNDPRITWIGRFLRASSIDELPQLVNVIAGDMSLVGPRPHPVWLNEKFSGLVNGYMARHRVKPGITGLAQVNGLRGETDTVEKMRRRVELDLLYIEKWSIWLDLAILARTALAVVKADNAY